MPPQVVIVGPPGSGKSSVAAALAEALGVQARDTDADVERATGMTIGEVFVVDGESAFRALEQEAVAAALAEHTGILAVGGGAVESAETRAALQSCLVVRLTVSASEAAKRVGISGSRPLLMGNVRSKWSQLMAERDPWYEEVADITVATDGQEIADVVAQISAHLPDGVEQQS